MIDSLLIGFNGNPVDHINTIKSMGKESGAYRDLDLAIIEYNNTSYRALDIFTYFYYQDKSGGKKPFHNADFLNPTILYLGTYLSRRGFTFDYVNLFHHEKDKLREMLLNNNILTIAVTTTFYVSFSPIIEIVSFIRQYNQFAKIVIGGPYILNQTNTEDIETLKNHLKYINADFYVISPEGEGSYIKIIDALKNDSGMDHIDNIAYRKGDDYIFTSRSGEYNPLEENMVDYKLFQKAGFGDSVSIRTAKSCPFSCAFCSSNRRRDLGEYKYLNVNMIEKELDSIRDLALINFIDVVDDTYNVPVKRFKEILRLMIKKKYGFKWYSTYRCDFGDDETIDLMKESGCQGVFLGVESGSDRILENMNKTARREHFLKAIPQLTKAGIYTHANFVIGFPGETDNTVHEMINLIEETKPTSFRTQLWYADPTTPIWKRKDEFGIIGSSFSWSHNTMDSNRACDWIDKIFLTIRNSTWQPQYGFESWSIFYLQRLGMTLDQVLTFIKCFNTAIKERLFYPEDNEINPDTLEDLKRSCQFDRGIEPDMDRVDAFNHKIIAENFWLDRIKEIPDFLQLYYDFPPGEREYRLDTERIMLDKDILEGLNRLAGEQKINISNVILTIFKLLLFRLTENRDICLGLYAPGKNGDSVRRDLNIIPVWTHISEDIEFCDLAEKVTKNTDEALQNGEFPIYDLLKKSLHRKNRGQERPIFSVLYGFWEEMDRIEEFIKKNGEAPCELMLIAIKQGDVLHLVMEYDTGLFLDTTVREYLMNLEHFAKLLIY
ncbi:MAG: PhpK family radical SAM P-methyltransferase [Colwellia sp.]|nr:PhpK family radical SAM P-methyltransferase [Colwellia sp.]